MLAFLQKCARFTRKILTNRWTKPVVFIGCLIPLAAEAAGWFAWLGQDLGGNPIEDLTHETGEWVLKFLMASLAVTPLRKLLRIPELIHYRRMLGLFAFFYTVVHLYTYVWMDKFFDLDAIFHDLAYHPYITIGTFSFVLLLPLVITSTRGWIIRLHGRWWRRLHRLVYAAVFLGVFHYYLVMRADESDVWMYAAIFGAIFLLRAYTVWRPPARA